MTTEADPLRDAFIEARDSAVAQYKSYLAGWRPKNPNEQEKKIIALLEELTPEQKEENRILIESFVEAALFKLVVSLEEGIAQHSFRLSTVSRDGSEVALVSDDIDRDLPHQFFHWMKR